MMLRCGVLRCGAPYVHVVLQAISLHTTHLLLHTDRYGSTIYQPAGCGFRTMARRGKNNLWQVVHTTLLCITLSALLHHGQIKHPATCKTKWSQHVQRLLPQTHTSSCVSRWWHSQQKHYSTTCAVQRKEESN